MMYCAKYLQPKNVSLHSLEKPTLRTPNDVLIHVAYAGICPDDILIYSKDEHSLEWPGLEPLEGHEFTGIVTEVGALAAKQFNVGDRVSGLAWSFCGNCYYCRSGMENHCLNQSAVSTFASEIVMDQRQLCHLPDSVSLKQGVFTDPTTYCLYSDLQHVPHLPNPNVLIFGCTAMSLIMLQLVRIQGAAQIVVVESQPQLADLARKLGADLVIDPYAKDMISSALKFSGGLGFHLIYEMAHQPSNLRIATKLLAYRGTILVSSMYDSSDFSMSELFLREGCLRFFALAPYMLMEVERVLPRLNLDALITKVLPFSQINQAFVLQMQEQSVKVLLRLDPPAGE